MTYGYVTKAEILLRNYFHHAIGIKRPMARINRKERKKKMAILKSEFLRDSDGGETMTSQNFLIFLYMVGDSEVSVP